MESNSENRFKMGISLLKIVTKFPEDKKFDFFCIDNNLSVYQKNEFC